MFRRPSFKLWQRGVAQVCVRLLQNPQEETGRPAGGGTLIHVYLLLPQINQITEGKVVMTVLEGRSAVIQGSFSK